MPLDAPGSKVDVRVFGGKKAKRDIYGSKSMNNQFLILKLNSEFVREGKALLDDIGGIVAGMEDKKLNEDLDLIRSCLEEFGTYDRFAEKVGPDSLIEYDFFKGFTDAFQVTRHDQNQNLRFLYNGKEVQPDEEYKSLFVVSGCLPSVKLLPTLLMDNAVKYSLPGRDISINLGDFYGKKFTVSNWGPKLEPNEEEAIFSLDSCYRGKWAVMTTVEGHGIGLRQAKMIILLHSWLQAKIVASSSQEDIEMINQVPYSLFSISLFFFDDFKQDEIAVELPGIREKLARFLFHDYIRVNPLLFKRVMMLSKGMSEIPCGTGVDVLHLRKSVFKLKCLILEHLIKWHEQDRAFALENDIQIFDEGGRFDERLCRAIHEFAENKNLELAIEARGDGFTVSPMYSSYDVFFYLFADYIIKTCDSGRLIVQSDNDGILLSTPERVGFRPFDEHRFFLMEGILLKRGLRMRTDFKNTFVRIERFS